MNSSAGSGRMEEALDCIHGWLRDHAPHREALLQPPLTRQNIDDLVGTTKVLLPQDTYPLYEWRNGLADRECLFPGYEFKPLPDAVEYLNHSYANEDLRAFENYGWLFVFPVQLSYGGYALFCDAKPRQTAPVDYDLAAATDSLTDLVVILSEKFKAGVFVVDDEGELDFAGGFSPMGLDRDECYRRILQEDWETLSQAVLRIGFQVARDTNADFALEKSLPMFRNPSSRMWSEPLILTEFMINLSFSRRSAAHEMTTRLLQHPDAHIRWQAAYLVGNSQYFDQYDWVRPLADYFAGELAQAEVPKSVRDDLILSFGKTGDRRAVPLLKDLGGEKMRPDMKAVVARMCLERVTWR